MEAHRLTLPPGYRIESYEIIRALGKGGFGITYQAQDVQIGRMVAIKELLPDSIATRVEGSTVVPQSATHEESWQWARERFIEEARILAGFRHPNIIAVHRIVEANGTVYLVMDCIEGESYGARLRRIGREPNETSLRAVIDPLLDGLHEVHAAGLLHRDIKPENILIDKRGQPVLIDFGAARSSVGATMTMTSIVTHGYSPAEQYQTKGKIGPWTDIYAIGAVMCRAITGEKPMVASDRLMEDEFLWLSHRPIPGISGSCLKAVDWALRVRPEDRPKSIPEWAACFGGACLSTRIDIPAAAPAEPTIRVSESNIAGPLLQPERKSQSALPVAVLAIVLIVSAFVTGMFILAKQSEKRVEAARVEAARVEAARVEAARVEAARVEAARVEAARVEAQRKSSEDEQRGVGANIQGTRSKDSARLRSLIQAAEDGNADAQFNLGVIYRSGTEIAKSDVEAAKWYRKAAEQGIATAQFNLGCMYLNGAGVDKNKIEAAKWIKMAADQGMKVAQDAYKNIASH